MKKRVFFPLLIALIVFSSVAFAYEDSASTDFSQPYGDAHGTYLYCYYEPKSLTVACKAHTRLSMSLGDTDYYSYVLITTADNAQHYSVGYDYSGGFCDSGEAHGTPGYDPKRIVHYAQRSVEYYDYTYRWTAY